MNQIVKDAVEKYYISNSEQMKRSLAAAAKEKAKYDKENEGRHAFLITVMGKPLYNKCCNNGAIETFAPIPVSGIHYCIDDFNKFAKANNLICKEDSLDKLCCCMRECYPKNDFRVRGEEISTDIVFNTIDMVIDFFYALLKCVNKAYKTKLSADCVNWKPICKKFRDYLG